MLRRDMLHFQPAAGWEKNVDDYLFCRCDAVVARDRKLRAEITWLDDDKVEGPLPENHLYYDPQLLLETNSEHPVNGWVTVDSVIIKIDEDEANRILSWPPSDLLNRYAVEWAKLKTKDTQTDEAQTTTTVEHPLS